MERLIPQSKTYKPKSSNIQNNWHSTKVSKSVKVIKTKKLSQTGGDYGNMTTTCIVRSWVGFWNRKKILVELGKSE